VSIPDPDDGSLPIQAGPGSVPTPAGYLPLLRLLCHQLQPGAAGESNLADGQGKIKNDSVKIVIYM